MPFSYINLFSPFSYFIISLIRPSAHFSSKMWCGFRVISFISFIHTIFSIHFSISIMYLTLLITLLPLSLYFPIYHFQDWLSALSQWLHWIHATISLQSLLISHCIFMIICLFTLVFNIHWSCHKIGYQIQICYDIALVIVPFPGVIIYSLVTFFFASFASMLLHQ